MEWNDHKSQFELILNNRSESKGLWFNPSVEVQRRQEAFYSTGIVNGSRIISVNIIMRS
jgi:hypothetical protein